MAIFLKAAINGARTSTQQGSLPVSAAAIADVAQKVVAAGAQAIHFHIRDIRGMESLAPDDAGRCIMACRRAAPATPLGVSTGAWIMPDVDRRLSFISQWQVMPNFVSVNFHEQGAEEVANLLYSRGVGIELGLSTPSAVERALTDGWGKRCLRILLEPEEAGVVPARANVQAMERILDRASVSAPRLLHGFDTTAWPLLIEAVRRSYQCRIGFEDTLSLPTGERATSNVEMISVAIAVIAQES